MRQTERDMRSAQGREAKKNGTVPSCCRCTPKKPRAHPVRRRGVGIGGESRRRDRQERLGRGEDAGGVVRADGAEVRLSRCLRLVVDVGQAPQPAVARRGGVARRVLPPSEAPPSASAVAAAPAATAAAAAASPAGGPTACARWPRRRGHWPATPAPLPPPRGRHRPPAQGPPPAPPRRRRYRRRHCRRHHFVGPPPPLGARRARRHRRRRRQLGSSLPPNWHLSRLAEK